MDVGLCEDLQGFLLNRHAGAPRQVNIFVTNRFVAVPEVLGSERMLVEQLGVSGFYHVIVRCVSQLMLPHAS